MLESFSPIVHRDCKMLIFGSMPGRESLRRGQYYAFKRNQFWKIVYKLFDREPDEQYENKVKFLIEHKIALWDVLKYCEREGSLDSNIKNESPNEIIEFLNKYTNIKHIFFNGTKARDMFKKHVGFDIAGIESYHTLPSTSPANTKPEKEKLKEWSIIKKMTIYN
ncbi:DNA-deoxyinosine glycosylase [Clostridiisalibacter paucivorans]|uniref:DNA-deoxyinosine glycosylase n=1 Tax=Clostridiisalibacter paucivorans TaxID=408753 RepID=UPI000A6AAF96|nr:DNA-deoxyinosine glycosylase [Clostridiisalibacter paucivorans]